jgi:hypothetical protein
VTLIASAVRESPKSALYKAFLGGSLIINPEIIMTTFAANTRHMVQVELNVATGNCDVTVSDKLSNKTFVKSLALTQYNRLVDWLKENDHGFAMNSIHSMF